MEIENLAGVWPNVAIDPATGKTYGRDCDRCYESFDGELKRLKAENEHLRKVVQIQADSFAAIENENTALRLKLNRIRELAERLDDGTRNV